MSNDIDNNNFKEDLIMEKESKGKFTQVPDEWWGLCGKYQVKDKNGKDKIVHVSHTYVILLAKISNFNKRKQGTDKVNVCVMNNAYFANIFKVSQGTISNMLSDLYQLGWVKSYEERDENYNTKRFLYLDNYAIHEVLTKVDNDLIKGNFTESLSDLFN